MNEDFSAVRGILVALVLGLLFWGLVAWVYVR